MAEQLERFVQMIAAPVVIKKKSVSSEAFTTVGSATDLSLADLTECEAMEGEHVVIDADFEHVMRDEEQQLNEDLDSLRAELKQEKDYNQRQNQAHQGRIRKLQQKLQKVKNEDDARKKALAVKVAKIRETLQWENAELRQKLESARELNKLLKQKLDAAATNLAEGKNTGTRLKSHLHTLGVALSDGAHRARRLSQEIADDSAVQRAGHIEVERANCELRTLQNKMDSLRAAASQRSQEICEISRERYEMWWALQDDTQILQALECNCLAAENELEHILWRAEHCHLEPVQKLDRFRKCFVTFVGCIFLLTNQNPLCTCRFLYYETLYYRVYRSPTK